MSKQNKTINFLYEASKLFPTNEIYTAIRSRMLVKCSALNPSASLQLKVEPRCEACGVLFKDVSPLNIIHPVKKPKCYNKIKNGASINTKYQNLFLKKFNKYKNDKQIMIKQCKLCKNQIKTTLNKTGHTRLKKVQVNPQDELNKKKKLRNQLRKKNREFSGLKKSAVLSAKRALELEDSNNRSPKKIKTDTDVINLITPVSIKRKNQNFSTPEINTTPNVLTPNNNKIVHTSTPFCGDSEIICLDSPEKQVKIIKTLNDMFTPIFTDNKKNKTIIEISDSEAQAQDATNTSKRKKNKKNNKKNKSQPVQIIEQTPKLKNNNNVVLVAEQSTADKKQKKLNNLSAFLKNASNIEKPNHNKTLQNFLSTFT